MHRHDEAYNETDELDEFDELAEREDGASEPIIWSVPPEQAGERIDKFITEVNEEQASRSQVQGWIMDELITVNGQVVKANYKVRANDRIAFRRPEQVDDDIVAENIPLDIVYEDSDIIVVNKRRGMVVHPAAGHRSGTLVNALLYHCKHLSELNGGDRLGIVHRIDKDTSGLLMVAKNNHVHAALAEQLKRRTVLRKYTAIVHGALAHQIGSVEAPIGRDPHDRKRFVVRASQSKEAITHFSVINTFRDYSLLELKLETGRTHQIRVHMEFIDHPIVGDPVYGKSKGLTMEGQALHASALGFTHPTTGEYMEFMAPLPADMEALLAQIKKLND